MKKSNGVWVNALSCVFLPPIWQYHLTVTIVLGRTRSWPTVLDSTAANKQMRDLVASSKVSHRPLEAGDPNGKQKSVLQFGRIKAVKSQSEGSSAGKYATLYTKVFIIGCWA